MGLKELFGIGETAAQKLEREISERVLTEHNSGPMKPVVDDKRLELLKMNVRPAPTAGSSSDIEQFRLAINEILAVLTSLQENVEICARNIKKLDTRLSIQESQYIDKLMGGD